MTVVTGCVGDCGGASYFDLLAGDYDGYRPTDEVRTAAELSIVLCASGRENAPGRALDLMCGPGRHSLGLLALGWQVDAIDNTPELLELLRARADARGHGARLRGMRGDVYTAELPSGIDLVLILGNSFGFAADRAASAELLCSIATGLTPGGSLAVEIFDQPTRRREAHAKGKTHLLPDGRVLSKQITWNPTASTEHVTVTIRGASDVVRTCYRQYLPDVAQLVAVAADAGLAVRGPVAGWPSDDSHLMISGVSHERHVVDPTIA